MIRKKMNAGIQAIHDDTDFKVSFAGVTQLREFQYDHGGIVKPDLEYHIHYTNEKEEVFMTGGVHSSDSKIIYRIGGTQSLLSTYTELKGSIKKQKYPTNIVRTPTPADYRLGYFTRYFTRQSNIDNSAILEISETDFENQNNLYTYADLIWLIAGDKIRIGRSNRITILNINEILPGIIRQLPLYQYFRPTADSQEYLEKRLALRRENF